MLSEKETPSPNKKRVPKRKTTRSKTVVKKTRLEKITKKSVKQTSAKKQRKIPAKQTTKTRTKETVAKTKAVKSAKPVNDVVKLPNNMSQRAIEKSAILNWEFSKILRDSFQRVAYVASFCFLLVGATYATVSLVNPQFGLKAEAITSSDTIKTTAGAGGISDGGTTPDITDSQESEFHWLTSVPHNIVEPTTIRMTVTRAADIRAKLVSVERSNITLAVERVSGDEYTVVIPAPATVTPGYYRVYVQIFELDQIHSHIEKTHAFFMGDETTEYQFNHLEETVVDTTQILQTEEQKTPEDTEKTPEDTEIVWNEDTPDNPETTVTETVNVSQADSTSPETNDTAESTVEAVDFKLFSPVGSTLTGVATLKVSLPVSLTSIELNARPVNSTSHRFVTLASKRLDSWVFAFDSRNLPNGDYYFFATAKRGEQSFVSHSLKLKVYNVYDRPVASSDTEDTEKTHEASSEGYQSSDDELERKYTINEILKIDEGDGEPKTSGDVETTDNPPVVQFESSVKGEVDQLLKDKQAELSDLFKRYAVARQTGDESLLKAAREAIKKKQAEIAIEVVQDQKYSGIADTINTKLEERFAQQEKRLDTFEELRKERSSGATAVDTDGDGISDVDEETLYKTDPTKVDSDNDGVTDGIEIVRGYDPTNDAPEAVIAFESPKETIGLTRDDVLKVESVTPIVSEEKAVEEPPVTAEITGRGLPNSYVTLFIFSSPTVVTVRTDADGNFAYTFDKELPDGKHDVYVAVTDNAGEIVAQSNPFSFTKQAQAFTPTSAENTTEVSPQPITEVAANTGYNVAAGVGILAFGLILLMLGISLKRNQGADEAVVIEETKDVTPATTDITT